MLNTTHIKMGINTSNVVLNTPSHGMMQRSHPKSFFIRFAKGSTMESFVFNSDGKQSCIIKKDRWGDWQPDTSIDVLQIMVFGDIEYLCEVVRTEHLNESVEQ